jgi:hypothetical protein
VIPMSYRTILSTTWEITHFFAGIDHGVGHGWALRVRSESSNAPYSTKIIHDFVPVSVTNITHRVKKLEHAFSSELGHPQHLASDLSFLHTDS